MDKSPLAMLAKACETIGYNSDSASPNKGKAHPKNVNNGSCKTNNRHSLQNSPHGNHANNYLDMNGKMHDNSLNGKHIKKENGQQHVRKGSPRNNGALTCEPSTSSPSNCQSQQGHPFSMANNGTFPGLLQRCFSGSIPPNAMQMPNQQTLGMMPGMPMPPTFPGAYPAGANPFFMAAMAAYGQPGMQPPNGMMPHPPTSRIPNSGATPNPITTTTTALSAPIPATSQPLPNPQSKTPPATTNHQQTALNKRSTSSALATPTSASTSQINQMATQQAEIDFATAMAQMNQQQAMASVMFGSPFGGSFPPAAMFAPQNGNMHPAAAMMMQAMVGSATGPAAQAYMENSTATQGSSASVQAMLMAAACGQQPRFVCTYATIKGSSCGKSFETETELFGHYRQHISQLTSTTSASSPILVSSTTTDPTVSTASSAPPSTPNINTPAIQQQTSGGGKMKTHSVKQSSPPVASPKQAASLPPNLSMWNGSPSQMAPPPPAASCNSAAASRFHPYSMKMPHQQPPTSAAQFQQQQQAMAAAVAMNAQQHQAQQFIAMQQMAQYQAEMAMVAAAGMPPPFAMMNPAQQMAFANGLMMQQQGQQQQVVEKTV